METSRRDVFYVRSALILKTCKSRGAWVTADVRGFPPNISELDDLPESQEANIV